MPSTSQGVEMGMLKQGKKGNEVSMLAWLGACSSMLGGMVLFGLL